MYKTTLTIYQYRHKLFERVNYGTTTLIFLTPNFDLLNKGQTDRQGFFLSFSTDLYLFILNKGQTIENGRTSWTSSKIYQCKCEIRVKQGQKRERIHVHGT